MRANRGNREKNKENWAFLGFIMGEKQKTIGGKTCPQARGKQRKHKKTKKNIKKRLIYFFNCDILLLVKGTETHESNENKAFRKIDKAPRTNRNESQAET